MKKISIWLLATLLIVAGCGGNDNAEEYGSVLKRALPTEPESLDAHKARSIQAADVLRDLGEGLVTHSPGGELIPGTASSWEISEDGLTYTFSLRPEARWSNGDPVTAQDFVTGMERLVDPATAAFYAEFLSDIAEVGALDDHTLVIKLARPTPYLLSLLTHPAAYPMHAPSLAEHGDSFARPGNLVSNGAYVLNAWIPGSIIVLRRNEHYWNNAATAIDEVQHHIIVQETAELARYRAGEIHITSVVPPENFAQVRDEMGDQLRVAPYLGIYYYGYNLTKPPFKDNPKLRQALSMAIDRELIVERVTGRGEAPAYSWVRPGMSNYEPPQLSYAALTQDERNQIARRLYVEAGYSEDNPLDVEIRYNTSDTHQRVALAIQSMWQEVLGFEATLINEEFQVLLANMREQEVTQVFRSSWIGDYDDAHDFLKNLQTGNPMNMPGYSSEQYDSLMTRAALQVDPERRRLYLEEAERVMLADHPTIPIYFYVSKHLIHPDIEGWGDNVLDYHYSQHLSFKAAE
ncbi:MAG: peptide ABC transporter substrate-binding protein [Pseudomonadota bacterium]